MFDLRKLRLKDTIECAARVRKIGADASSQEEVSTRVVRFFHEALLDGATTRPACALVKAYATSPLHRLDPDRRDFALAMNGGAPLDPGTVCLTLLSTAGALPEWCSVDMSKRHQVIPLPGPAALDRLPMVAALIDQLGLDRREVFQPGPAHGPEAAAKVYNVFHVPDAVHSPLLPAQEDFVIPFGIRSVIGFGGALPSGQLIAVLLFSKVPIRAQTAGMFRLVALSLQIAMAPFTPRDVFPRPTTATPELQP